MMKPIVIASSPLSKLASRSEDWQRLRSGESRVERPQPGGKVLDKSAQVRPLPGRTSGHLGRCPPAGGEAGLTLVDGKKVLVEPICSKVTERASG